MSLTLSYAASNKHQLFTKKTDSNGNIYKKSESGIFLILMGILLAHYP